MLIFQLTHKTTKTDFSPMPRTLRIQLPGACYHVINRGNYRHAIFATEGAANAFLKTLFEAVQRYGWKLHAYVLMSNHYHLALETPRPNLVEGMHWLQGTFSNRFNRFRNERGHVFQGRYKALILEDTTILCRVVDYIHLNPVRAGIVAPEHVDKYAHGSLVDFLKKKRPAGLECAKWLERRGSRQDWTGGIKSYVEYLRQLGSSEQEQKKAGLEKLSRGWALGTHGWKQALARELSQRIFVEGLGAEEISEVREHRWEGTFEKALEKENKTRKDILTKPRAQQWKIRVAKALREEGVAVGWISKNLHLGKASSVRSYMSRLEKRKS
jgi:REP element-mobilizing transposase RayT